MPKTKQQFEDIRKGKVNQIRDAAMLLFANEGFHSTSISSIAKKANISKGLLYNYFESKEALLKFIFYGIVEEIMAPLIPVNDKPINYDDSESFIDQMFDLVIDNAKEWKLFYQLAIQQDVMEILMSENLSNKFIRYQKFMFNYFAEREFDDLQITILHFSSVYKGFAMSYVFAPELFDKESINRFKVLLKGFFVKPKRIIPRKDIEIDEFMAYLLL